MLNLSLINSTTAVEVNDDFTMLWILLSGILVFFMQAGFTLVESGFTRSKNAVNISMKNILDISVGTLSYWAIGYGLMYGASMDGSQLQTFSSILAMDLTMFFSRQFSVLLQQPLFLELSLEEQSTLLTYSLPYSNGLGLSHFRWMAMER